jgi:hypothetical protein
MHTIIDRGGIFPHERHGGVAVNEGEKGTPLSMITKTQYEILWSINNQRGHQKFK